VTDLQRGLEGLGQALKSSEITRQSLEGEVEFLNRYLSYATSPNDASKATFINLVCALWKESEKRRVHIDRSPLDIPQIQIQNGLSPELRALLERYGISRETLDRASQPSVVVQPVGVAPFTINRTAPNFPAQEAVATIQKQARNIGLIKVVTFADGLRFEVPPEIALTVHTRADCSPL
jgi:hypothetical protein